MSPARPHLIRLGVALAVVVVAAAVWFTSQAQRAAEVRAEAEVAAAQQLLTAMLDQETGLRGFLLTGERDLLGPYERGRGDFERAAAALEAGEADESDEEQDGASTHLRPARAWQALADADLDAVRAGGRRPSLTEHAAQRSELIEDFRERTEEFLAEETEEGKAAEDRAALMAVIVIIVLSLGFAAVGYLVFERRARKAGRRREADMRFRDALQAARGETEAYGVLRIHLETVHSPARATVLNRNNSDDRLEPMTPVADDPALADRLIDAQPASCLAIRSGRDHHRTPGERSYLACEVCGDLRQPSSCVPSLVGGEVIGSVLVQRPRPLPREDADHVRNAVMEAAPTVANMRTLAVAELRASTDALTGLANRRAAGETAHRMAAHAGRTATPLAAILFDLDHFKHINDTHGHPKGDEVLAAVGDVASSVVRASDFAGRYGGEEFLVLLPGADAEGARVVAEKLRDAISRLQVNGVDRAVTASFGVAAVPEHAGDANELLRQADRALYVAKHAGRDRVQVAGAPAAA
jgi:diguanylate cyclase (GGDEF)-like protein